MWWHIDTYLCVFIHCLFKYAVSSSDYTASNDRVINELEGSWKKPVVA
jgi:hypothetical protein